MLKWNAKKENENLGVIELGNLKFNINDDYIEVAMDIFSMSNDLNEEVQKGIQAGMDNASRWIEEFNKENNANHPTIWSDKPVEIIFTYLRAIINENNPTEYYICVGFNDADDDRMEQWDTEIKVDLSENDTELKKEIIKALVDKFF